MNAASPDGCSLTSRIARRTSPTMCLSLARISTRPGTTRKRSRSSSATTRSSSAPQRPGGTAGGRGPRAHRRPPAPGSPLVIEDYLGPGLAEELALLDFADWEPQSEPHVHRVSANWKVSLDTFRENYHFNYLHRRTLAKYAYGGVLTFDAFGRHLRNCSALRSIDELRGRPESRWGDVSSHISLQYALFPNTSLTFDRRHADLWQVLPLSPQASGTKKMTKLRSERLNLIRQALPALDAGFLHPSGPGFRPRRRTTWRTAAAPGTGCWLRRGCLGSRAGRRHAWETWGRNCGLAAIGG